MNEEMNFDLDRIEVPVTIRGERYWLVEASEDAAAKWRNANMRAVKFGREGNPSGIDGLGDVQSYLLSLCLYRSDPEGRLVLTPKGDPDPIALVPQAIIKRWPSRVVKPLFERAKEISDLREGEDTKEQLEAGVKRLQAKLDALTAKDGDAKKEQEPATGS